MDILRIKIEEILKPTEECKLVVELNELIVPSGSTFIESRRKIYLSIIQRSEEKHCTAIFVFRPIQTIENVSNKYGYLLLDSDSNTFAKLEAVYPIKAEGFTIKNIGDCRFDISWSKEKILFKLEGDSNTIVINFVSLVTKFIQLISRKAQEIRTSDLVQKSSSQQVLLQQLLQEEYAWTQSYNNKISNEPSSSISETPTITTTEETTIPSPEEKLSLAPSQSTDMLFLSNLSSSNTSPEELQPSSTSSFKRSRSGRRTLPPLPNSNSPRSAESPSSTPTTTSSPPTTSPVSSSPASTTPLSTSGSLRKEDSSLISSFNSNKQQRSTHVVKKDMFSTQAKDDWIQKMMKKKVDEFTDLRPLSVVIGTWNVNSKIPQKTTQFDIWFHNQDEHFELADIYVIGLQEVDMTASALIKEETEVGGAWNNLFQIYFKGLKEPYQMIRYKQLVGLYICVFVKQAHLKYLKDVKSCSEGVGALGMLGNKGGVAIRFQLFETTFCFINAHLAPHMDSVAKRNQNFHDIVKRTDFSMGPNYSPENHDYFFWFGDLNYRLDMDYFECKATIERKEWDVLIKHDQLTVEKLAGRVLQGYEEGRINFQPSYRFDPGTDNYDTSEKRRTPAYCDRILWRKQQPNSPYYIRQHFYEMYKELQISDHKPVVSRFDVAARVIIEEKYRTCYRDLIKVLDKMENDMLPEISLSTRELQFKNLKYNSPQSKVLILENVGQVICEYYFLTKPNDQYPSKPWLIAEPQGGIILPGEKSELKFTVTLDAVTAAPIHLGQDSVDDILILHLKNGRDHFISVTGNYMHSCFANTIENLIQLQDPVRVHQQKLANNEAKYMAQKLKLPKELWKLVDYIFRNGLTVPDLFTENGDPYDLEIIREKLDNGETFDDYKGSVNSVAAALLEFLESLADPIIPVEVYKACIQASSDFSACLEILKHIPAAHYNCFHYIMALLREKIAFSKHSTSGSSSSSPDALAVIFSKALMRPIKFTRTQQMLQHQQQHAQTGAVQFIKQFLRDDVDWSTVTMVRD